MLGLLDHNFPIFVWPALATLCACFFALGWMTRASMSPLTDWLLPVSRDDHPVWYWFNQVVWLLGAALFAAISIALLRG